MKLFGLFVFLSVFVTVLCLHIQHNASFEIPLNHSISDLKSNQNDSNSDNSNVTIKSRTRRVIGGKPTSISSRPWHVSLRRCNQHNCCGSIISQRFVITAAHCFSYVKDNNAKDYNVRVGSAYRISGGLLVGIKNIIIHPKYRIDAHDYDYALLYLTEELSFNENITAIGLPTQYPNILEGSTRCVVSGWGRRTYGWEELHEVNFTIFNQNNCNYYNRRLTERMLCAGSHNYGEDTCAGDSGGPLACYLNSSGDPLLIGIVSFGPGICGDIEKLGVYSKVSSVRDWIKENTGL